ncbi:hypothetical protein ACFFU9_00965 [Mariniflexile ostreae]|uniref:Uncharacterized protein n=1 Tax=Mariniflexile ostreae TaxID=1520892 RepID=A0ABV5F771_9FLAO
MKYLSHFFKSIVRACPYSLIGRKCMDVVHGKPKTTKKSSDKIQALKKGVKTGRNISLVGVFCPFFWYAILSGASKDFIIFNAIHSGIVVGLGLVVLSVNYLALYAYTKPKENN